MTPTIRQVPRWLLLAAACVTVAVVAVGSTTSVLAQKAVSIPHFNEKQLPPSVAGMTGAPAVTVFLDRGPEKVKAAELLTQLHAAMASRGYTFADLEPYEENADLEGWWVTYVAR